MGKERRREGEGECRLTGDIGEKKERKQGEEGGRKLGDEGRVDKNKKGWKGGEKKKKRLPVPGGAARKFFPPFSALLPLPHPASVFSQTVCSLPLPPSLILLLSSTHPRCLSPSLPTKFTIPMETL